MKRDLIFQEKIFLNFLRMHGGREPGTFGASSTTKSKKVKEMSVLKFQSKESWVVEKPDLSFCKKLREIFFRRVRSLFMDLITITYFSMKPFS